MRETEKMSMKRTLVGEPGNFSFLGGKALDKNLAPSIFKGLVGILLFLQET